MPGVAAPPPGITSGGPEGPRMIHPEAQNPSQTKTPEKPGPSPESIILAERVKQEQTAEKPTEKILRDLAGETEAVQASFKAPEPFSASEVVPDRVQLGGVHDVATDISEADRQAAMQAYKERQQVQKKPSEEIAANLQARPDTYGENDESSVGQVRPVDTNPEAIGAATAKGNREADLRAVGQPTYPEQVNDQSQEALVAAGIDPKVFSEEGLSSHRVDRGANAQYERRLHMQQRGFRAWLNRGRSYLPQHILGTDRRMPGSEPRVVKVKRPDTNEPNIIPVPRRSEDPEPSFVGVARPDDTGDAHFEPSPDTTSTTHVAHEAFVQSQVTDQRGQDGVYSTGEANIPDTAEAVAPGVYVDTNAKEPVTKPQRHPDGVHFTGDTTIPTNAEAVSPGVYVETTSTTSQVQEPTVSTIEEAASQTTANQATNASEEARAESGTSQTENAVDANAKYTEEQVAPPKPKTEISESEVRTEAQLTNLEHQLINQMSELVEMNRKQQETIDSFINQQEAMVGPLMEIAKIQADERLSETEKSRLSQKHWLALIAATLVRETVSTANETATGSANG